MYNKDMETKKYIMWSDGVLTSFGVEGGLTEDGLQKVINPVSIAFAVVNEPVLDADGNIQTDSNNQPIMKGGLKWEMTPYVFGACLGDATKNVWTVKPNYILDKDATFNEQLVSHYETLVGLCGGEFPAPAPAPEDGTTPEGDESGEDVGEQ